MAQMKIKYTGNLYQFKPSEDCKVGDYVEVNGPYDTFGRVKEINGDIALVRGIPQTMENPVWKY